MNTHENIVRFVMEELSPLLKNKAETKTERHYEKVARFVIQELRPFLESEAKPTIESDHDKVASVIICMENGIKWKFGKNPAPKLETPT